MLKLIPLLLLAAGLPGIAGAQIATPDIHVSYRDLDLHSAAGVRAFDRRLTRAIGQVCLDDGGPDVSFKIAALRCRTAKRAEVNAQRDAVLASLTKANEAIASTR